MVLKQHTLGARLRDAREEADVSLESAAHHVRKASQWLEQVESGAERIPLTFILQLADLYGFDVSDIIEGKTGASRATAKFRAEEHETTPLETADLMHTLHIAECLSYLLDISQEGKSWPHVDPAPAVPRSWNEARMQGEAQARALRVEMHLEHEPIEAIRSLDLIRRCFVLEADLHAGVSGISLEPLIGAPIIIIPAAEMGERKRFSIMHELAHHLYDKPREPLVSAHFSRRLHETRADAFAGALLLPEGAITRFAGTRGKEPAELHFADIADLSVLYGVSFDCAAYRLFLGRWINRSDFEALRTHAKQGRGRRRQIGERHEKLWESERWPRLRTFSLRKAAQAYRRDLITEERFLEYAATFGFPQEKYKDLLEGLMADV